MTGDTPTVATVTGNGADVPRMIDAERLTVGTRYWWCGRPVEVIEVARRWTRYRGRAGITVTVAPINGEGWPPRALAYFADEQVELTGRWKR